MAQNEYKRQMILLRAHERGYTGHVRLERRTLTANMRFTVSGAGDHDRLNALLFARRGDRAYLRKLGEFTTDSRGQSGLVATFDPRDIAGLDLKQTDLVIVVRTGTEPPALVLTGLVNGSKDVDWGAVARAVNDAYAHKLARTREEAETQADIETQADTGTQAEPEAEPVPESEPDPETEMGSAPASESEPVSEPASESEPEPASEPEPEPTSEPEPEPTSEPEPADPTAFTQLHMDAQSEWPQDIAAIRGIFETAQASDIFQLDDFVFVEAPLPNEDGSNGVCAIGLRARDGLPVNVCYALPGAQGIEPPPGLEDYRRLDGWWYTVLDVGAEKEMGDGETAEEEG